MCVCVCVCVCCMHFLIINIIISSYGFFKFWSLVKIITNIICFLIIITYKMLI